MAKQSRKQIPDIDNLLYSMNFMYERLDARDKCQPQLQYLASVKHNMTVIHELIRRGTLEQCLDTIDGILLRDLKSLAKTEKHIEAIQQNIKNFKDARNNLDALQNRPDEYRRQALGYIDDYKLRGGVPKDGMHGALRSYVGHLDARDSQYLMQEETDFIAAQRELVAEITKRYIAMQKKILGLDK